MTVQTKHFIELPDIVALRLVCKECGATLSLLLSDEKLATGENRPQMFLSNCPVCHRNWAEIGGSSYEPLIRKATAALHRLKELLHGDAAAPLGFSLTLEIKPEAAPDQKMKA